MNAESDRPLVSVFMPAYNQQDLIAESIESVLAQHYDDWELIIGDDCSEDNTYEIIKSYQAKYPDKIVAFRNSTNLGLAGNFNAVLRQCRGKYVAFMGGDDVLLPYKLALQVELMKENEACVLCYHDVEYFDTETGLAIRYQNAGNHGVSAIVGTSKVVAKAIVERGNSFIAAMSVLARRDAIPQQGFDARVPITSDWLMWIEICADNEGTILFVPGVHAKYRKHSHNVTKTMRSMMREDQFVTMAIVEARYPWLIESVQKLRAVWYLELGYDKMRAREYPVARGLLLYAIRLAGYRWNYIRPWLGFWLKYGGLYPNR